VLILKGINDLVEGGFIILFVSVSVITEFDRKFEGIFKNFT